MGKGNRKNRLRAETKMLEEEKNLREAEKKKSKKTQGRAIASACIIFALVIVAVLVLNVLSEAGVFLRGQVAMSQTETNSGEEIVVDNAMMTFFINDNIANWYNNYYVYMMYGLISLNTSKDLKDQKLTATDASYLGDSSLAGETWYNYFVNTVVENVEMYVTYATAAKKIGLTLDENDYSEIDTTISELKASLKEYKMSFADQYGKGVTEKDVRNCYELLYLASKYGEYKQDKTTERIEGEEGLTTMLNFRDDVKNKGQFYSAEYLSYSISVSEKKEGSPKLYDAAVKAAKEAAEKIAAAKTPADFAALVKAYEDSLKAEKETSTSTSTSTSTETETSTSTAETKDPAEEYKETIYYETSDELGKWIFDETNPANVGDSKVIEETGSETATEKATTTKKEETTTATESGSEKETTKDGKIVYETYKVTVYLLSKAPDLDRSKTQNIAYLITDDKAAAEEFLAAFLALKDSEKSRDKFEELAEKQNEKLHASHNHDDPNHKEPVFSYAQADQAKENFFADDYDDLNKWLDDADRKDNSWTDSLIKITVKGSDSKTTTYYAALYFEGHDEPAWYVDALQGAVQKEIDDWYQDELKKGLINYNWDAIGDITLLRVG